MKKVMVMLLSAAVFIGGCSQRKNSSSPAAANATTPTQENKVEATDRLNDSAKILDELLNAPDAGAPAWVLEKAQCVMVVPSMIKGGFVIGGRHGRGAVTCRNAGKGWSAPAFVTITGGSWGAQIGVESVDLVLLFMGEKGVTNLLNNNVKLGAEASVAAGPVGRQAAGATDASMTAQVLSYSRTKGLFAGLELSGAGVRPDEDSNIGVYGRNINYRNILSGSVPAPAGSENFLASVRKNFREAAAKAP